METLTSRLTFEISITQCGRYPFLFKAYVSQLYLLESNHLQGQHNFYWIFCRAGKFIEVLRILLNRINIALGNGKFQVEVVAHSLRPICAGLKPFHLLSSIASSLLIKTPRFFETSGTSHALAQPYTLNISIFNTCWLKATSIMVCDAMLFRGERVTRCNVRLPPSSMPHHYSCQRHGPFLFLKLLPL